MNSRIIVFNYGLGSNPFGLAANPSVFTLKSMAYRLWIRWISYFQLLLTCARPPARARARLSKYLILPNPSNPTGLKLSVSTVSDGLTPNPLFNPSNPTVKT